MNETQLLLIAAIRDGALELTHRNAIGVLDLYRAMADFVRRLPKAPDMEFIADCNAVEKWLLVAMRAGMGVPEDVSDQELIAAALGVDFLKATSKQ